MEPFDLPDGQEIVDIVTRSHEAVTGTAASGRGPHLSLLLLRGRRYLALESGTFPAWNTVLQEGSTPPRERTTSGPPSARWRPAPR